MHKSMDDKKIAKWYILHTYGGYENIVQANIKQLIENQNLQDSIFDIVIPTEQVVEERNGKRKVVVNKVFPCYVYVKLIYSSELWYLLTNTRGVTGFVGPQGKAWALSDEEVERLGLEKVVIELSIAVGDNVRVINGPFEGLVGTVKSIDSTHQKVGISLSMFGRETFVEMEFRQIEQLK